eukprot:CAMPEP_0175968826 /NCGR_PEP_ID=MMETSP0108-20121206/40118_1 /TAXON_ID=195067 ORGANISM="Goniomonas pacifica, Strain CCMP1869" /NCGR_SAMPLE_ID=MMETSP0108 /ASSEMBLY_ACC=CAM_ASM_000204 /LENGTH=238 /DNA_ID=CAMNT_0017297533 /DNA_START=102 /DNA_END=815 /DNA_ORIENTATION=+
MFGTTSFKGKQRQECKEVFLEEYVDFVRQGQMYDKHMAAQEQLRQSEQREIVLVDSETEANRDHEVENIAAVLTGWEDDDELGTEILATLEPVSDEHADVQITAEEQRAAVHAEGRAALVQWLVHAASVSTKAQLQKIIGPPGPGAAPAVDVNCSTHEDMTTATLLKMNPGELYLEAEQDARFGAIPSMASCSIGQLGALNAESFCERVISAANLVMTDGRTMLSDEELEWCVVLRIN